MTTYQRGLSQKSWQFSLVLKWEFASQATEGMRRYRGKYRRHRIYLAVKNWRPYFNGLMHGDIIPHKKFRSTHWFQDWVIWEVSITDNPGSFCLFFSLSSASFGLNPQADPNHGHQMLSPLRASHAGMTVSSWRRGYPFPCASFSKPHSLHILLFRLAHSTPKLLARETRRPL